MAASKPVLDAFNAARLQLEGGSSRRVSEVPNLPKLGSPGAAVQIERHNSQFDYNDAANFLSYTKRLMVETKGSALVAWVKHFDSNNDGRISVKEFTKGMRDLGYTGTHEDLLKMWKEVDTDNSGVITFDEIDNDANEAWSMFRRWLAEKFENEKEAVKALGENHWSEDLNEYIVSEASFCKVLIELDWRHGLQEDLYECLDRDGYGFLTAACLPFFPAEKQKQKLRAAALARCGVKWTLKVEQQAKVEQALMDFAEFMRKKYSGNTFRGWISGLDKDRSMSLMQPELFKACSRLGFPGDMRALWTALNSDNKGFCTIDDVDPFAAQIVAEFTDLLRTKFGSVSLGFRGLDRKNAKRLKAEEFAAELRRIGFARGKYIYYSVISEPGARYLKEEDLRFLDRWKPPLWLLSKPNQRAAEEFKKKLLGRFPGDHVLRGWRTVLDTDNSNQVSWPEFERGCKSIGYTGDVGGAWRYFDDDMSGFITLKELDEPAHNHLVSFRRWAIAEFGSVKEAFDILDADGSGDLSQREFRRGVRDWNYGGNADGLFDALKNEKKHLVVKDAFFLDQWGAEDVRSRVRRTLTNRLRPTLMRAKTLVLKPRSESDSDSSDSDTDEKDPDQDLKEQIRVIRRSSVALNANTRRLSQLMSGAAASRLDPTRPGAARLRGPSIMSERTRLQRRLPTLDFCNRCFGSLKGGRANTCMCELWLFTEKKSLGSGPGLDMNQTSPTTFWKPRSTHVKLSPIIPVASMSLQPAGPDSPKFIEDSMSRTARSTLGQSWYSRFR